MARSPGPTGRLCCALARSGNMSGSTGADMGKREVVPAGEGAGR